MIDMMIQVIKIYFLIIFENQSYVDLILQNVVNIIDNVAVDTDTDTDTEQNLF